MSLSPGIRLPVCIALATASLGCRGEAPAPADAPVAAPGSPAAAGSSPPEAKRPRALDCDPVLRGLCG